LGGYVFTVSATDNAGTGSNELAASHILRTKNYFPTLADPVVPDTVVVPTTNQVNAVRLTVAVQDTNGIDDIASVKVSIIRVENGTIAGIYDMFDDGGTTVLQPFGLVSGDITAGDGTYSILFPVANTTNHNMYRDFKFVAIDRSGSESAPKTKRVYFK
ncbi:MAG: hypothetical protein NTV54_03585, partial [Ignavibacteriales bacterium]|nr:hypothetical protein [Ignavibacteriales bacterium]